MWKVDTSKVVAPPVSIKDRWVGPHEQMLNVPMTYWYMRPVSLVAYHRQKLGLSLLLHWLWGGKKLGGTRRSVSRRAEDVVGNPYFSRAVGSVQIYRRLAKCEIRMVEGHTWTERGKQVACWSSFPLQGVHRFESQRLSDMSTACLWQSSSSKLINLMSLF
jgi:hypothetical protein